MCQIRQADEASVLHRPEFTGELNMEPTDFYNRSKRNLAAFTSFFALILFGGVAPEEGTKILGFILAKDTLPAVLFVVVLYLLYQFILAISFQPDSIRKQQL